MNDSFWKKKTDNTIILLVIPIVLAMVVCFLMLTGNIILNLSKDKMVLQSKIYAENLIRWSEQIVSQLNVYKTVLEEEGDLNAHSIEILSASYGAYDGYPFGLYWGDENKKFHDLSGWDPGPEYDPTGRGWYSEGLEHTDSFGFGKPYVDMRTGKTAVAVTTKIDCARVATVLAADVYFDYVVALMEEAARTNINRAFVVAEDSRLIIADSDWNMTGKIIDETISFELYGKIDELLDEGMIGMTTVQADENYYVNIQRIDKLNWLFVTCMKQNDMLHDLHHVNIYIFVISAAACVVLIFLTRAASLLMTSASQKAKTDPLTKLLNRDGLSELMNAGLKKKDDCGILLMFDVDNFKRVNDELGHPTGDRFLRDFAELLQAYFNRNTDFCARFGGDEFAVYVQKELERKELVSMLDRFMNRFHEKFDAAYARQNLSVSIGAAYAGANGHTVEELYKSADGALYQAKQSGKNRYVIAKAAAEKEETMDIK